MTKEATNILPDKQAETNLYCKAYLKAKKDAEKAEAERKDAGNILLASTGEYAGTYKTQKYAFTVVGESTTKTIKAKWDEIQKLYPSLYAKLVEKELVIETEGIKNAYITGVREL